MPFPNEHAARQASPSGFKRFRRGSLSGAPTGVSAVFGVHSDGKSEIQSLRFDRAKFTPKQARMWLREHGFKARLEEATTKNDDEAEAEFNLTVKIAKTDTEQRLVFGWLYVSKKADGTPVTDHSRERIQPHELEKAAYNFVLHSRTAGRSHEEIGVGRLVESVVFTAEKRKAMGVPDGVLPDGHWVGFKIDEDEAWDGVKSGKFTMFSLGGTALRRSLTA